MSEAGEFLRRVRMLFRRNQVQAELEEEIRLHLELREQQYAEKGLASEAARGAAYRRFGNPTVIKERSYQTWGWGWLENLFEDLRYALRQISKSAGFTTTVVLTLALGIGANTAIFTLLHGLVLRDLPVDHPSQLVSVGIEAPNNSSLDGAMVFGMYQQIRDRQRSFSGTSAWRMNHVAVQDKDGTLHLYPASLVTGDGFEMLGVRPYLGRLLNASDDVRGGPVEGWPVVLSYGFWSDRFGRDPNIIGEQIKAGSSVLTVVGIAPSSFTGIVPGMNPRVYLPFQIHSLLDKDSQDLDYGCDFIARLRPGVTLNQANAELKVFQNQLFDRSLPSELVHSSGFNGASIKATSVRTGFSHFRNEYKQPLLIMQALVGVVLLLCSVNVSGLMMSKAHDRRREFAIRKALGASRWRLIRQNWIESLMIAMGGAVLGGSAAWFSNRVLFRFFIDRDLPEGLAITPDRTVLVVTGMLAVSSTIVFGLLPFFFASRSESGNLLTSRSREEGRRKRIGRIFVPVQLGLSLVLISTAVLLSRCLEQVEREDPGFEARHVISQWPLLYQHLPQRGNALLDVYQRMVDRLKEMPGIESATVVALTGIGDGSSSSQFQPIGGLKNRERYVLAFNFVGPGYFDTMQIPILAGRGFESGERNLSVCVVSASAAKSLFPNGEAIEQLIRATDTGQFPDKPCRVVGIARDTKFLDFRQPAPPMIYYPISAEAEARYGNLTFLMRADRQADGINGFEKAASEIMPTVPLNRFATLHQQIDETFGSQRLITLMSSSFGVVALILSAIGLYGLLSSSVVQRTREMGIRLALGGTRCSILMAILKDAMLLFAAGIGLGGILLYPALKGIGHMPYRIFVFDPIALLGSILLLTLAAFLAAFLPAHRASKVDPIVALRYE